MTTKKDTFTLQFGGFAPKISDQLRGCGLAVRWLREFDRDADALTRLYVRGFLTSAEARRARDRLTKKIAGLLSSKKEKA